MGLISKQTAAKRLGREIRTIDDWIEHGILKATKVQRTPDVKATVLLDEKQVNAMLATESEIRKAVQQRDDELKKVHQELDDIRRASGLDDWPIHKLIDTAMRAAQDVLTEREYQIMKWVCDGEHYDPIAERLGLTRERVRQLFEKSFRKLYVHITKANKAIEAYDSVVLERDALEQEVIRLRKMMAMNERTEIEKDREKLLALSLRENFQGDLSVRALNCLRSARIDTLGQLTQLKRTDLLKFRNFGRKSITEVEELMSKYNLTWRAA